MISSKLKVAVLMGGKSIEKEASFNSGRTICDHLDTSRYEIIPLFQQSNGILYILPWRFLHRGKISDFEHKLAQEASALSWDQLNRLVDIVFIAMHGRFAEDGTLQGLLETLKIPYVGSKVLASALGMDKNMQKKILAHNGIKIPRFITLEPHQINAQYATSLLKNSALEFPVIVKPYKEGSSFGVSVVRTQEQLLDALMKASHINNNKKQAVIIEEYITGMEFTCIIITDYKTNKLIPLPPTEIVIEKNADIFDYEQKYMPGRATKFTPARCNAEITQKIQDTCISVMQILGITNLARIDGFVQPDNTIVIIDPNSLAGMSPSSFVFRQAAEYNMSHTQFINHLLETELKHYNMLNKIVEQETKSQLTMSEKKLKIGVLLGGSSHEKEISLESGRNIFYKLAPHKYTAIPLFVSSNLELYHINQQLLVRNSTKEIELSLTPEMRINWSELPSLIDFAFIGLHGGEGENGCVQGMLEMLGLPYNGSSVLTSALCIDKFKTNQFLKSEGFNVPESLLISVQEWEDNKKTCLDKIKQALTFPIIIKPHDDGCSVLVQKARTDIEIINSIEQIFKDGKQYTLLEECIQAMELTVGVVGNHAVHALPPSQTVVARDILSIEEKFLPGAGENQTPAPLAQSALSLVKTTIEEVYKALNCKGYARIDCFYEPAHQSPTGQERVIILEVNSLPGMTPATCIFHQAAEVGMKPMEFIDLIVQLGLEEHKQEAVTHEFFNNNQKSKISDLSL
jgi:UDP-N-acetylmuramate--alanine ligase